MPLGTAASVWRVITTRSPSFDQFVAQPQPEVQRVRFFFPEASARAVVETAMTGIDDHGVKIFRLDRDDAVRSSGSIHFTRSVARHQDVAVPLQAPARTG